MPPPKYLHETVTPTGGTIPERHLFNGIQDTRLGCDTVVLLADEEPTGPPRRDTAFENAQGLNVAGGFYSIGAAQTAKYYMNLQEKRQTALEATDQEMRWKLEQDAHQRAQRRAQEAHEQKMKLEHEQSTRMQMDLERSKRATPNLNVLTTHTYNNYQHGTPPESNSTRAYSSQVDDDSPMDIDSPVNSTKIYPWLHPLPNAARPEPLHTQPTSRLPIHLPVAHPEPSPFPRAQRDSQLTHPPRTVNTGFIQPSQFWMDVSGGLASVAMDEDMNDDEDDSAIDEWPGLT